jgi:prophage regulatory protein
VQEFSMTARADWRQSSLIIVTAKELVQLVPYTIQHIGRLEKLKKFPRRISVGARRVGWRLSDIEDWIAARAAEPALRPPSSIKNASPRG